jgi:hypothetical protein
LKKKPHGFSQEYATKFHSVNVIADIIKDNSNVTLITIFVGELLKPQWWQYDRKKRDHVEISRPAIVCLEQPLPEC